jgi:hypothetical protein
MSRIIDFDDGFTSETPSTIVPYAAEDVTVVPAGNLSSTDVQSALEELQGDIDTINSTPVDAANKTLSNLTAPVALNEDLVGEDNTKNLGSASIPFNSVYANTVSKINELRDLLQVLAVNINSRQLNSSDGQIVLDFSTTDQISMPGFAVDSLIEFIHNVSQYEDTGPAIFLKGASGGPVLIGSRDIQTPGVAPSAVNFIVGAITDTDETINSNNLDIVGSFNLGHGNGGSISVLAGAATQEGDGGNIFLIAGGSVSGNQGIISVTGKFLLFQTHATDPTHPLLTEGALYYNNSSQEFRYYDGSIWKPVGQVTFDSISPMTTLGDIIYGGTSGTGSRLPIGSEGDVLTVSSGIPSWQPNVGSTPLLSVTHQASTYTVTTADDVIILSGASWSLTLYSAVSNPGRQIRITHNGSNLSQVYTLLTTGGELIAGFASGDYSLYTSGETLQLYSDGTDWQILDHRTNTDLISSGTLTITGSTTNPTKGTTPTVDDVSWKRSGCYAHIIWTYSNANAGSAGSGTYSLSLPTNMTADTTKLTALGATLTDDTSRTNAASYCGQASFFRTGVARGEGRVLLRSSTSIQMTATQFFSANAIFDSTSTYNPGNTNTGWRIEATIPILGWKP